MNSILIFLRLFFHIYIKPLLGRFQSSQPCIVCKHHIPGIDIEKHSFWIPYTCKPLRAGDLLLLAISGRQKAGTPSTLSPKCSGEGIDVSSSNLCIFHLQNMAEIHTSSALMLCTSICKPSLNCALKALLYRCFRTSEYLLLQ